MTWFRVLLAMPAWLGAALLLAVAPVAMAHPSFSATALVKVTSEGELSLILRHDALAFALDELPGRIADRPMYELLDAPEATQNEVFAEGRDRFAALTKVMADGKKVALTITQSPDAAGVKAWRAGRPSSPLPVKLDFVAHSRLPAGTREITIEFPRVLGDALLTIDRPGDEPLGFPLRSGETSPPLELSLTRPAGGGDGAASGHAGDSQRADAALRTPVESLTWLDVSARYVILGFTHILPGGFDHVLFVLGLFLLSPRVKALLWQITAFTIAHSLTLTLTTLHLVTLPSIVIEPTIAASIAFIGIENLTTTRVRRWRPVVAFVFGLVHGMGFASALSEVGLPTGQLVAGLVSFNVGVECGHLTVLAVAFGVLGWWRRRPWFRARVVVPLSVVIAGVALFWMVQRIVQPG